MLSGRYPRCRIQLEIRKIEFRGCVGIALTRFKLMKGDLAKQSIMDGEAPCPWIKEDDVW